MKGYVLEGKNRIVAVDVIAIGEVRTKDGAPLRSKRR